MEKETEKKTVQDHEVDADFEKTDLPDWDELNFDCSFHFGKDFDPQTMKGTPAGKNSTLYSAIESIDEKWKEWKQHERNCLMIYLKKLEKLDFNRDSAHKEFQKINQSYTETKVIEADDCEGGQNLIASILDDILTILCIRHNTRTVELEFELCLPERTEDHE